MKLKFLLIATMTLVASTVFAQEGGLKGRVLSRNGRTAVGNVAVTIEGTTYKAQTNDEGYFELKGVPAGDYKLSFTAPDFENLDIVVKVENNVKDINAVTGYIRGGCTAIGMKKQYVTRIEEAARDLEQIIVSGGKLGTQLELTPDDLCKASNAEYADITVK